MSDTSMQFAQIMVTAIVGLITTLGLAWIAYKTKVNETENTRRADSQDEKLSVIEETTDKTHSLVNAPMAAALLLAKVTTKRLWELSKDPSDEAIYLRAEKDYNDHVQRQVEVDAIQTKKAQKK